VPSAEVDGNSLTVLGVEGARFFVDGVIVEQDSTCPCVFEIPEGTGEVTVQWIIRTSPRSMGWLTVPIDTTPPVECDPAHPSVLDRPPVVFPNDGIIIGHSNGVLFGEELVAAHPGWVNQSRPGHDASDWVDDKSRVYSDAIASNPDARAVLTILSERVENKFGPQALAIFEDQMRVLIPRLQEDLPNLETIILRSRSTGRYSEASGNRQGEPWTFMHNEIMRDLADEFDGVEFVNVWDAGGGEGCRQYLVREDFRSDGIHPNEDGARKIYEVFEAQIE
jgi:hypothetical protein